MIIASSDKKLIKNSNNSSNDFRENRFQYNEELLELKNEKNIFLANKFWECIFFNEENFTKKNEDIIVTTFYLKSRQLILKSYLLNNKKNLDIPAYDKLIKKGIKMMIILKFQFFMILKILINI